LFILFASPIFIHFLGLIRRLSAPRLYWWSQPSGISSTTPPWTEI